MTFREIINAETGNKLDYKKSQIKKEEVGMTISEKSGFECVHEQFCRTREHNENKCETCKHNTMRNYKVDFYEAANDNEIPKKCPRLYYDGRAEQTKGYKCPVCESFTNPYRLRNNRCAHCGYILNVGYSF